MKYKVAELMNRLNKNQYIESVISYKHKINDEYLDVEDAKVEGDFDYIKKEDMFVFHLHITSSITSPCVITLKPVKVLVDFDTDLFYTFKVADDDSFPIVNNTIELDEEIWGEIILHMPVRVLAEDAEYEIEDEVKIEKENPFSSLDGENEEE